MKKRTSNDESEAWSDLPVEQFSTDFAPPWQETQNKGPQQEGEERWEIGERFDGPELSSLSQPTLPPAKRITLLVVGGIGALVAIGWLGWSFLPRPSSTPPLRSAPPLESAPPPQALPQPRTPLPPVTSVNKPPRVVSATPPTNVVELVGGAEQSFRLAVEDPERETLAYEWTVDGKKTGAQPTFTWKAQKEGKYRIKAIAKDQQGLTVAKEWQVVVVAPPSALPPPAPLVPENTAPHIAQRLPAERIVAAREGEVVQFSALALDPDGEEVSYGWLVDGQHAAQGDRFVYTAGAVGKHVIELKATDPGGLNDTFRWEVHVEAPPVAPRVVMHTPYEEWVLLYDHLSRFFAVEVEVPGLPEAPIQYAWQIDGRLAGGRELLEFKNQPPGQHEVTVTATGPSEASVTHRWVVDVRERERLDEHAVSGPPRLEMFALENEVSADKKRVTVKGQLRNVGSREAENIIVWISALDAQQKTLSRRLALPAPQPLSPGQVATFARSFVDQSAISDFHVEIVIK